jgi:transcriptional regulator with XRE-family HTH domain
MGPVERRRGLSEVIADNARGIRATRRLRQVDVAARAGLSRTVLSVIESGARRITVEDCDALCLGLGVTLVRLLDGADPEALRRMGF